MASTKKTSGNTARRRKKAARAFRLPERGAQVEIDFKPPWPRISMVDENPVRSQPMNHKCPFRPVRFKIDGAVCQDGSNEFPVPSICHRTRRLAMCNVNEHSAGMVHLLQLRARMVSPQESKRQRISRQCVIA